jgi:hypothetical protein
MKIKFILVSLLILMFSTSAFAYDKAVTFIRNSSFSKCGYKTVGQAIDEAFQNPQWESGKASDGELIVNVTGIVIYDGNKYKCMMQFAPRPNNKFETNGMSMNGKVMSPEFKSKFITELCK